jgi:hypothetical protein
VIVFWYMTPCTFMKRYRRLGTNAAIWSVRRPIECVCLYCSKALIQTSFKAILPFFCYFSLNTGTGLLVTDVSREIKEEEMGEVCSTYGGEDKCVQSFGRKTWRKEPHL